MIIYYYYGLFGGKAVFKITIKMIFVLLSYVDLFTQQSLLLNPFPRF